MANFGHFIAEIRPNFNQNSIEIRPNLVIFSKFSQNSMKIRPNLVISSQFSQNFTKIQLKFNWNLKFVIFRLKFDQISIEILRDGGGMLQRDSRSPIDTSKFIYATYNITSNGGE